MLNDGGAKMKKKKSLALRSLWFPKANKKKFKLSMTILCHTAEECQDAAEHRRREGQESFKGDSV